MLRLDARGRKALADIHRVCRWTVREPWRDGHPVAALHMAFFKAVVKFGVQTGFYFDRVADLALARVERAYARRAA